MSTRQRSILVAAVLLLAAIGLATLAGGDRVEQALVPDAPYPGEPTGVACDADCSLFVEAIATPLRTLVAEGDALAELGNARSRDILELTVRMNRFQESAAAFSEALANNPTPESLRAAVESINTAIAAAQAAIDDSIAALRSFNWDDLGLAVDRFDREINTLIILSDALPVISGQE